MFNTEGHCNFFFQIPFFPVITKDLTFIHLGNDSIVDGLVSKLSCSLKLDFISNKKMIKYLTRLNMAFFYVMEMKKLLKQSNPTVDSQVSSITTTEMPSFQVYNIPVRLYLVTQH